MDRCVGRRELEDLVLGLGLWMSRADEARHPRFLDPCQFLGTTQRLGVRVLNLDAAQMMRDDRVDRRLLDRVRPLCRRFRLKVR